MNLAKKWVTTLVGALLGLILICGALLPTWLSSQSGKRFIIRRFENSSGAKVSIDTLSLSWMGEQKIDKFTFDDGKKVRLGFQHLISNCSFWNLIFRRGSIGETRVISPWISIEAIEPSAPKSKALEKRVKEKKTSSFWSDYSGKIIAENGNIDILNVKKSLLSMKEVHLEIDTPKSSRLFTLIAQGITQQNDLHGNFSIHTKIDKWIEGIANINNFPVEGIDQMIGIFKPAYQGTFLSALGDTLNLSLNAKSSEMTLNIRSPRLLINLNTVYQNSLLSLKEEGRIAWTVKPQIWNAFIEGSQLNGDAQAEVRLQTISLPLKNQQFKWEDLATKGNLYFSGGNIFLEKLKQGLFINEIGSDFETSKLKEFLDLSFQSNLRLEAFPETQIGGLVTIKNPLEKKRFYPKYDLKIENLPLALIDTWEKSDFVKYLGKAANGRVMRSEKQMIVSVNTPLLTLTQSEFIISDMAHLTQPATFTYVLSRSIYDQLASPVTLNGTLNSLSIPLKGESLDFFTTTFDLQLKTQNITLENPFAMGAVTLPFVDLNIEGKSLDAIQFNGTSRLDFSPQTWGLSLFGSQVGIKTSGKLRWAEEIEISPFFVQFDGKNFKSILDGAIEKSVLTLKKPLKITFLLQKDQINAIIAKESNYPLLAKSIPFHLEIRPSRLPLKERDLSSLAMKGNGHIDNLAMISPANGYAFNFENVNVDFDFDGKKNSQAIHFEANALEKERRAGDLSLELKSTIKANLIKSPTKVGALFKNFSSQIADALFNMRGQLPDMIGQQLNLNYLMEKRSDQQNIDLKIDSPEFFLDGAFAVRGDQFELRSARNPLKIHWNVSEKSYDAFQRWRRPGVPETPNNPLFEIKDKSQIKIQIAPLVMPLKEKGDSFPNVDFNLFKSLFDANVRIDDLTLKQGLSNALTNLSRFDFDIAKYSLGNTPMTFKFNGNVHPQSGGHLGHVRGEGKLENFLSKQGHLDLSNVTSEMHADIKNLPSVFVDALSRFDQDGGYPPSAFLGDLFNATFDVDIQKSQGSLLMDIDASACRATFSGIVSDGVIYLQKPLHAAFTISPQLNRVLEKSANLVVISMEKPIYLIINPKGFAVPLKDLHIRNMNFTYGQLDLGQIICKNTGSASDISSLFKTQKDKNISFWFAPMEFNMRKGKMFVDRTEILYNHALQVCLWGDINFVRRYVDMILGLTAQAMASALSITSVSPDYVLKVPVKGPFGNVKIDTKAAAGKIAFLIARKQVAPKAGIWGQVLGAIGDLADDQSDVPPPKPPFPWQK